MLTRLTRRRLLGSMIAGGLAVSPGRAVNAAPATPVASPAADLTTALDTLLRSPQAGTGEPFSGAVLITQQGRVLHEAAYGDAEVVEQVPNTPETGFQIASITKTFTATLIMMVRDEGLLDLDDPAARYLPGLPHLERDGVPVTIRHLLGHTSGVPDFITLYDLYDLTAYPATLDELLDRIAAEPLLFTPGSDYAYSSSGYLYLGRIIEAVTGSTWEAVLTERILSPLELRDTWLTPPRRNSPLATGYLPLEGFIVPVSRLGRPDLAESAGGLTSTVADLETWLDAFLAGRVVAPDTVSEMLERGPYRYGLGFEYATLGGAEWLGHYGTTIGFRSALFHQPETEATIILLSNRQDLEIVALAEQVGTLLTSG
jgi:CubicO group peptidase (beta-lactamase class C family)